jgi:hypothetical protein
MLKKVRNFFPNKKFRTFIESKPIKITVYLNDPQEKNFICQTGSLTLIKLKIQGLFYSIIFYIHFSILRSCESLFTVKTPKLKNIYFNLAEKNFNLSIEKFVRLDDRADIDNEDFFQELVWNYNLMGIHLHLIAIEQKNLGENLTNSNYFRLPILREENETITTKELENKKSFLLNQIENQQNKIGALNASIRNVYEKSNHDASRLKQIENEYKNLSLKTIVTREASVPQAKNLQSRQKYPRIKQNLIHNLEYKLKKAENVDLCFLVTNFFNSTFTGKNWSIKNY